MEYYSPENKPNFSASEKEISFKEMHELTTFNTWKHHWCFYDKKRNYLFDQYAILVETDAKSYLQGIGLIDENCDIIDYFEY